MKYITLLPVCLSFMAFAEETQLNKAPDFGAEFTKILSSEPNQETREVLEAIGLAEVKRILTTESSKETKEILAAIGAAKLKKIVSTEAGQKANAFAAAVSITPKTKANLASETKPQNTSKSQLGASPTAGDIATEFTKALSGAQGDRTTPEAILNFADTHISEGDYSAALDILTDTPDGTPEWYEVYGSAALGDRQQKKALKAYIEAKKLYEQQGNKDKVNQMNAMIKSLSPKP